jgi:hypothetical protein
MESLELITFILIALLASGLFIGFIFGTDFNQIFQQFFSSVSNKNEIVDKKTTLFELANEIDSCWSNCFFGDKNMSCGAFYVVNEEFSNFDLNEVKKIIKKNNLCSDCNLIVPESVLPVVVGVECIESNSGYILISK